MEKGMQIVPCDIETEKPAMDVADVTNNSVSRIKRAESVTDGRFSLIPN